MRVARAALAVLLLVSSVEAATKKKTVRRAPKAPPVSAKARAEAKEYAQSHATDVVRRPLENPAGLVPFFERLYRLEKEPSSPSVHILHWGDSHTAADEWTGTMRSLLQARFGDAGSGFSPAGRPFKGYRRIGEKSTMSRGWTTLGLLDKEGDGNYGLSGVAIAASRAGETAMLEAEAQQAELWYYRQPGGGSLRIRGDSGMAEAISTDGPAGLGVAQFQPVDPSWEVVTQESGPVRLYGWVVEKARGVTYESMGINGAQASQPSYWDQALWAQQIARRDPALVVLAYGTNEASNADWTLANYKQAFSQLLGRIRAAAPAASILVIGPPDRMARVRNKGWQTFARMDEIVDAQRIAAVENRCAFWDWRGRMGGAGAMNRWVTAGYAAPDHAHFTMLGYQLLGDVIYRDILSEYTRFVKIRETLIDQTSNGQASDHHPNHPDRVEERHDPGAR